MIGSLNRYKVFVMTDVKLQAVLESLLVQIILLLLMQLKGLHTLHPLEKYTHQGLKEDVKRCRSFVIKNVLVLMFCCLR